MCACLPSDNKTSWSCQQISCQDVVTELNQPHWSL